jgi:WD40 repeat protein
MESKKIQLALKAQEGELSLPFVVDHCWIKSTGAARIAKAVLRLDFIFLRGEMPVLGKLIFEQIDEQASSGVVYPAHIMQGVQTDAAWDGSIEAALYHAEQNGFKIPPSSDLRWSVEVSEPVSGSRERHYEKIRPSEIITGRSAGVTFLLGIFHYFGNIAMFNTRRAFESIVALAALPFVNGGDNRLHGLAGHEEYKAKALQSLRRDSGSWNLHVVLAGSFNGDLQTPTGVEPCYAVTVKELMELIRRIVKNERDLERPQALDFGAYLRSKRAGFIGREWLFKKIADWCQGSSEPVMLITGEPGVGKSGLAAELVRRQDARVVACHFCQAANSDTVNPAIFIRSLSAKLADNLPAYRIALDGILPHILSMENCERNPIGAFCDGVISVLASLPAPGQRHCIVVDALDEVVSVGKSRTSILDLLSPHHLAQMPNWLCFVITTRLAPVVLSRFSGIRTLELKSDDPNNLKDIARYISVRLETDLVSKLENSGQIAEQVVERILKKSGGNFLYTINALSGIQQGSYTFDYIESRLPPSLNGLYLDYCLRVYEHHDSKLFLDVMPLLHALCSAREPLTRKELAAVLHLDPVDLAILLRPLGQFLLKRNRPDNEEAITFYHQSFVDWLTTISELNEFPVSRQKGNHLLASYCREAMSNSRATPSWYVRRHAVGHFLEVMDWDSATAALSDIEFIAARAEFQELRAMLSDYEQAVIALPEGEKERAIDASKQEMLDRYAIDLYRYSEANAKFRKGSRESEPRLPKPIQSVRLCSSDEAEAERRRIIETPNRLDVIKAFRTFVASNVAPLHKYVNQRGFAANLARNDAPAGPVHEEGGRRLAPLDCIKLIRQFSPQELYNPLPPCRAILEGHKHPIRCLALSKNGRIIASGDDEEIRIWDANTGVCNRVLKGHDGAVLSIAVSADGKLIVSGSADKTMRLWDSESGKCLIIMQAPEGSFMPVAICFDNRHIITGGKKNIHIWDISSGECIKVLKGHSHWITSISLTSDSRRIISASRDKTIRIWDFKTGCCLNVLRGHEEAITTLDVSADSRRIVSGGYGSSLRVWDGDTGECIKVLQAHRMWVRSVALSSDGKLLVSTGYDPILRIWDSYTGKCIQFLMGSEYYNSQMVISADGSRIILGGNDATIRILDSDRKDFVKKSRGHETRAIALDLSADCKQVVVGGYDRSLRIVDTVTRECLKVLQGHEQWIHFVALSSDGKRIVSIGYDDMLRIWDNDTGLCLNSLKWGCPNPFDGHQHIAVSADCKYIATEVNYSEIEIWDTDGGVCIRKLKGHSGGVNSIAFSADGKQIVSGYSDKTIRLWDSESGNCLQTIPTDAEPIGAIALSAHGRRIVWASNDNTIRFWDLDLGECFKAYTGHETLSWSVALSSDNKWIITSDSDETIKIWDINTRESVGVFFVRGLSGAVKINWGKLLMTTVVSCCVELFQFENLRIRA